MHNWSVDEKALQKYPEQYRKWRLEQLINFGLDGEKLDVAELKKALPNLMVDPAKKRYLQFLLSTR
ncbi:MAG: hypothetical protein UX60_C0007G0020 [Berkelbacteria bacterium GW2011_GWA2_46_7]|uniref:Uncharacterized protein n=1 Tax=Berkelbacteria bacterium GW2011_GWA2_46_7 TaxID=1618335 RepID=A0A0G1QHE8_9BACT|nr:MAG: hypothetical protein UX60_C0007G0020 [Berkelbacteria bacterium GW2011_GWA2_46_7]